MVTTFLGVIGGVFLVAFGLPLLFVPRRWAAVMRWPDVQRTTPLGDYFGRCLGGVAVAITALLLWYRDDATVQPLLLELVALAAGLLLGVHVRGALARDQPWTENLEIALYLGVGAAAVALRVGL